MLSCFVPGLFGIGEQCAPPSLHFAVLGVFRYRTYAIPVPKTAKTSRTSTTAHHPVVDISHRRLRRFASRMSDGAALWLSGALDINVLVCPFAPLARRVLRHVGWSAARILADKLADDRACVRAILTAISEWSEQGADLKEARFWTAVRAAVMVRLFPWHCKRSSKKDAGFGWWALAFATTLPQLVLHSAAPTYLRQHRCALRGVPVGIQLALWSRDFSATSWTTAVRFVLACLDTSCLHTPHDGIVYMCMDEWSSSWYVGRTKLLRKFGRHMWPGIIGRFREHLNSAFAHTAQSSEARYRCWRKSAPHHLLMLPLAAAADGYYQHFEEQLIAYAGPTFQKQSTHHAHRVRTTGRRAWPRLRAAASTRSEVAHNYTVALADPKFYAPRWKLWRPWPSWLQHREATDGLSEQDIRLRLYDAKPESLDDLTVWAGTAHNRLEWRKLWLTCEAPSVALRIWRNTGFLPPTARKRAREKVERFLRGVKYCQIFVFDVPSDRIDILTKTRAAVRQTCTRLAHLLGDGDHAFAAVRQLRFRCCRPKGRNDKLEDHRQTARTARLVEVVDTTPLEEALWAQRSDLWLVPTHAEVPSVADIDEVQKAVANSFQKWTSLLPLAPGDRQHLQDLLANTLAKTLPVCPRIEARRKYTDNIRHHGQLLSRGTPDNQVLPPDEIIAIPVDRDLRRRCFASKRAYTYRFFKHFCNAPEVYERCTIDIDEARLRRTALASLHLPGCGSVAALELPYAYLLYKCKCFAPNGAWQCNREHEHERPIIAAPFDQISAKVKRGARAFLVALQAVGLVSNPIKRQARLGEELTDLHSRLEGEAATRCDCCLRKRCALESCKIDAASFFTRCNRDRCIDIGLNILDVLESRGVEVVWLAKLPGTQDRIAKRNTTVPTRYFAVPLSFIRACLQWLRYDNVFRAGDVLLRQLAGLPMGNSFSPVLARALLDTSHHQLYKHPKTLAVDFPIFERTGWWPRKWLGSAYHVDDAIFWSQRVCAACIFKLISQVWPKDIGVTLESNAARYEFLHTWLDWTHNAEVGPVTAYRNRNARFALGFDERPKIAGFTPFLPPITKFHHIHTAFNAKLWLIAGLYEQQRSAEAIHHIVLLS